MKTAPATPPAGKFRLPEYPGLQLEVEVDEKFKELALYVDSGGTCSGRLIISTEVYLDPPVVSHVYAWYYCPVKVRTATRLVGDWLLSHGIDFREPLHRELCREMKYVIHRWEAALHAETETPATTSGPE